MSDLDGATGPVATAIRRPVGTLVAVILVVLFGALSVVGLPIQLTPDIAVPTLSVTTRWPGAAPAEVEREILEEQEEVLKGLTGLERMQSDAAPDQGTITLELAVGTDLDQALVRVSNKLAQVPSYPDTADQPVVSTGSASGPPLAVVLLQNTQSSEVGAYRTFAEEEVLPALERVRGVASIDLFGGRETEVVVRFDPTALAARGVPLTRLRDVVRAELQDVSAGLLPQGKREYTVRTLATPETIAQLEDLVLRAGTAESPTVRLGDVATVSEGLRIRRAYVFGNDRESLALLLRREAGSNVLEVTEEIKEVVARVDRDVLGPLGLELNVVNDQTAYIYGALGLVRQNLLVGGLLASLVLLLFLRSFPAAALVSIAIPICVVGTALGMSLLGRSVNVVSLAGMAFAVGMVVDNAIVVIEAIDGQRALGKSPARAALDGTQEVWGAILASTLTTAAVFLPIATWADEVGELLRDVAIAVSVSVFLSLAVSVFVIPSFAARILRAERTPSTGPLVRAGAAIQAGIVWVVRRITARLLPAALVTLAVPAAMTALALLLLPPMEYLPTGNRNFLFGVIVPPPGYSVDEVRQIGAKMQAALQPHLGVDVDGVPAIRRSFFAARPNQAFMGAATVDPDRIGELVTFYRAQQRTFPGVFGIANQASLFGRSIGSSRAVEIDITGPDLEVLVALGGRMMGMLGEALPDAQTRPIPGLDLGAPEIHVRPRRDDAARVGLSGAELGVIVDALVDGAIIGELGRTGEPKRDVVLRGLDDGVADRGALASARIATPSGQTVPLSTVADIVETVGPTTIRRVERRRAITLQVSPPEAVALEAALKTIRQDVVAPLEAEGLPPGVRVFISGTADDLSNAQRRMAGVLGLAVVISFLLLSALFEDFLAPVVVLVTVPLAAAGGVGGLRLVDALLGPQPLDVMTAVGFVILLGVVVNNAILVVDGALAQIRDGLNVPDALAWAVDRRTRPIAMSALTSLAGLLPLVLFPGSGSELYRGVGAVVLGGLAVSTALTLFVVPPVFRVVWFLGRRG
ncbi:MAG: HAE1 family hydrophobic/amphiphilic exporter-1 [Myxococcota bacterium]